MKQLFFSLCALVVLLSCQKHPDTPCQPCVNCPHREYCPTCDKCDSFHFASDSIWLDHIYYRSDSVRTGPCFNPDNSDEFVFYKSVGSKNLFEICIFNLSSHSERTVLQNQKVIGQPKWGKRGLIIFIGPDRKLYSVNADGTGLKTISFLYSNSHPTFSPDFDRILVTVGQGSIDESGNKILSFNGDRLDSIKAKDINGILNYTSWYSKDEIVGTYKNGSSMSVSVYNLVAKSITQKFTTTFEGYKDIQDLEYDAPCNSAVFSCLYDGLYTLKLEDSKLEKIKNTCESKWYEFISISPDGKKILVTRNDAHLINNDRDVYYRPDIYIMDIDGKNEHNVFE